MFARVCEKQERGVKWVKMARGLAEPMGGKGGGVNELRVGKLQP